MSWREGTLLDTIRPTVTDTLFPFTQQHQPKQHKQSLQYHYRKTTVDKWQKWIARARG